MKILYVCADPGVPAGGTKGASVHVDEMCRALTAAGHEVVLLARTVTEAAAARPETVVVKCPVPLRRWRRVPAVRPVARAADRRRLSRTMRGLLRTVQPDAVYERYALGVSAPSRAARAAGIPVVLEVNAPLVEEAARFRGRDSSPSAVRAERELWRAADVVVVPSAPLGKRASAAGQQRVLVLPNAVDPTLFRPLDGTAARAALGLTDRFVVAFAGTVRPWHDCRVLLDALALLPRVLRPALLLVGDSSRLDEEFVIDAGPDVQVVRTGAVEHTEVPRMLAAADVCVASLAADPALTYFSPLKALEYLACGRATVVADADGLALLAQAGAAVSYQPGSAADLARILEVLAADPSARAKLAECGRQYAATHDWHHVAASVVSAIESLDHGAYHATASRL